MRFKSPDDDEDIWFVLLDHISHHVPPAPAAAAARLDSKRPCRQPESQQAVGMRD